MKKNMKIFKKTIKMFSILFLTVISSLFFANKTKALTSDDGYNYVYFKYDYDFLREKVNTPYFNTIIANIKNELANSNYSYYVIYFTDNTTVHVLFANGSVDFQGYGDSSSSVKFQFASWEQRRILTYSLETGEKSTDTEFVKVSNKTVYTDVLTNVNVNTYNNINDLNPYFAIYDSNVNINTNAWSNKFYLFYDLNKNVLISHGGHMPLAKNNLESINMSVKKNTISANNKEYVLSEDLTITYNVDDYSNYIYQYKKSNADDWTNVGIVSNNSITLNITKNDTIYARILDRNNNYKVVASATMTITSINYDEYIKDNINISFGIKNNYANGTENIISKDLTIKYNVDDYSKYIYLYKKESESNWSTYNFTSNNTSLTLNVTYNTSYIARILDKKTNDVLATSTYTITGISDFNTLKLVKTFNSGTNGNDLYSLNITNTSNHDIPFKIQFGSNDFSSKYVPRISGIKGYIYNPTTQQKKDSDLVSIKDFKCYKEIEGDTEVWCTGVLSKPQGSSAYYQIIFENTDNYYLYYYDSFSNSDRSLDITTNLFKDYNKYRFNSNSNKAYIYLKNKGQANMKGSVIIPYYYLNNDDLSVKLLKYNRINNTYGDEYSSYFIGDNYYKEIPFTVDENTVPVLTNKKNQHCETYYYGEGTGNTDEGGYYTWIGDTKTFVPFSWGNSNLYNIYEGLTCYQEEPVYFYVHKDFKVSFNTIDEDKNSTSDVVISDDNGNIFFDIDKDSDNTDVYKEENKNFFDMVKESFNYFTSPLSEFLNMFTHFWNGLNIIIKYFIVFIFVFILALFILRFIL